MQNLGIDLLYQGIENKWETMQILLDRLGIGAEEAGYMGDDVVDLPVMNACGFSATPADSHVLAKRHARLISSQAGGHGAQPRKHRVGNGGTVGHRTSLPVGTDTGHRSDRFRGPTGSGRSRSPRGQ